MGGQQRRGQRRPQARQRSLRRQVRQVHAPGRDRRGPLPARRTVRTRRSRSLRLLHRARISVGAALAINVPSSRLLTIQGPSSADLRPILDGTGSERILDLTGGGRALLGSLILENGKTLGGASDGGGAIRSSVRLTISGTTIRNNRSIAGPGGGLLSTGTLTVLDSEIRGNTAGGKGGGVSATAANQIVRTVIAGNVATADGGGAWLGTGAGIEQSLIEANSAGGSGGGVAFAGNTIAIDRTTIRANSRGQREWWRTVRVGPGARRLLGHRGQHDGRRQQLVDERWRPAGGRQGQHEARERHHLRQRGPRWPGRSAARRPRARRARDHQQHRLRHVVPGRGPGLFDVRLRDLGPRQHHRLRWMRAAQRRRAARPSTPCSDRSTPTAARQRPVSRRRRLLPVLPIRGDSPALDAGTSCVPTDARGLDRTGPACDLGAFELTLAARDFRDDASGNLGPPSPVLASGTARVPISSIPGSALSGPAGNGSLDRPNAIPNAQIRGIDLEQTGFAAVPLRQIALDALPADAEVLDSDLPGADPARLLERGQRRRLASATSSTTGSTISPVNR